MYSLNQIIQTNDNCKSNDQQDRKLSFRNKMSNHKNHLNNNNNNNLSGFRISTKLMNESNYLVNDYDEDLDLDESSESNTNEYEDEESEDDEDINYFEYEDEQEFENLFKRIEIKIENKSFKSTQNLKTTLKYLFKLLKFYKLEHYMTDLIDNGYSNPISLNKLKQNDLDKFNVSPYDKKKFSKLQSFLGQITSTINQSNNTNTNHKFDPSELELLNENSKMFENIYEWQHNSLLFVNKTTSLDKNKQKVNSNSIEDFSSNSKSKAIIDFETNNNNNNNNSKTKNPSNNNQDNQQLKYNNNSNQIESSNLHKSNSKLVPSQTNNHLKQIAEPVWSEIKQSSNNNNNRDTNSARQQLLNKNPNTAMKRIVRSAATSSTSSSNFALNKRNSASSRAKSIEPTNFAKRSNTLNSIASKSIANLGKIFQKKMFSEYLESFESLSKMIFTDFMFCD